MKKILVALLAAGLAIGPVGSSGAFAAPNCPYGSVNGVCIQGTFVKKLSPGVYDTERCVITKKRLFRNEYYCKVGTRKKGFWFVGPILAGVPPVTVVVGAATLGVVGGAASAVGGRIAEKIWPHKQAPKSLAKGYHPGWGWGHRPRVVYHTDGGLLGPIIGGITGYIIGRNSRPEPEPAPPPPPPAPEPQQVTLTPWSADWYEYCNNKYKSFDAKTGFYTGFDGKQHFCS